MRTLSWKIVLAAASFAPALAFAEEPTAKPDAPHSGEIRIGENPLPSGTGQVIIVQEEPDKDAPRPGASPQDLMKRQLQQLREAQHGLAITLDAAKKEKGSYLGVSAAPPPTVLRKQLGLLPGMGLVVDFIVPDSPAAKAGLQQYDVLQKLDDQLIINPQQLAVLVRSHKPGDEIKLGIIHDGKPTTLSVTLVEHDLEPLAEAEANDDMMRRMITVMPEPALRPVRPGETFSAWSNVNSHAPGLTAASITWIDDGHAYTIQTNGDHKTFSEKDKDGKVIFEGPIDTKEQRDKLSPEQREKLQRMEQHMPGVPVAPGQPRKSGKDSEQK